jgi:hypothetical protein
MPRAEDQPFFHKQSNGTDIDRKALLEGWVRVPTLKRTQVHDNDIRCPNPPDASLRSHEVIKSRGKNKEQNDREL